MLKVTYKVLGNFSLKNYTDSHLSSRSYPYATTSSIRGCILGSMIQRKGRKFAEDNFHNLKNVQIFIKYPEKFRKTTSRMKMFANSSYTNKDNTYSTTVGIREYIAVEDVVFYIDETIIDIIELLENINRIGNSESMVQLYSIEKVDVMTDILMDWDKSIGFDVPIFEDYDWDKSVKGMVFENIYLYSENRMNKYIKKPCFIKDSLTINSMQNKLSTI